MSTLRFIDVERPILLYIAAFGPKAQALAGELGDGLVSGLPRGGTVGEMLANARRGATRAGRTLLADFYVSAMVTLAMLRPGEPVDSERMIAEYGAAVITGLHYLVARHLETGEDPPARLDWKQRPEIFGISFCIERGASCKPDRRDFGTLQELPHTI